jgi:hypothetical protein
MRQGDILNSAQQLVEEVPTGALATTMPRILADNGAITLTSGTLRMVSIQLPVGLLVTSLTFVSGSQAAGTPTHYLFGLYDNTRALLRPTADQLTAAWAANTAKTVNLTSTFTTTYTGQHYLGIMMTATTPVNLLGTSAMQAGIFTVTPVLDGFSSTGLTTTLPNPAAAFTAPGNGHPFAYVS